MDAKKVADFEFGDNVTGFFAVRRADVREYSKCRSGSAGCHRNNVPLAKRNTTLGLVKKGGRFIGVWT